MNIKVSFSVCVLALSTSLAVPLATAVELKPGDDLQAALNAEDVVHLAEGTYPVTEPLKILRPVRVIGAKDAQVIISGGKALAGWTHLGENRWQTVIPEVAGGDWQFRELFVEGARAIRARHPDEGTFRIETAGPDKRTSFVFHDGDILAWDEPQRIEFVFYHDWSLSRVRMASIDLEAKTAKLSDPVGQTTARHYAMDWFERQPRYHLENHPAFVTAPGEWHLEETSGTLTYLAHDGQDVNKLDVVAPIAPALLHIAETKDVELENLTFRHMNWQLPAGGCAGVQAAFHQVRPAQGQYENRREAKPAAVTVDNSNGISIRRCRFEQLGATGLWVRGNSSEASIDACVFRDCGANGMMIGDASSSDEATSKVSLEETLIERCGLEDYGAVGVWIGLANHITVRDCELRDLPYTGISVGWRWDPSPTSCHHNILEGNHIHHIMQKLSDGGGIYTLGRQPGTILRRNRIHHVPVNAGRAESNGMFLDEGTTDILIEENIIWSIARSPLRFHKAGKNVVQNNQLYRTREEIPMVRYNNTPEENIALEDNENHIGAPNAK